LSTVFTAEEQRWMARALELARRGWYSAAPNPRVGCVLVAGGEIVGEGFHARTGGPHAEAEARAMAGERARGATAYVSLEPCRHQGRTPPCTRALLDSGIARVVAAATDPNPRMAGEGLAELRAGGIEVAAGLLEGAARELNPGFERRMRDGRPRVTLTLAASLDGRTAMASGESHWISSEASRDDVQRLRAESCAVLTGIGTVLADDPGLDLRREDLPTRGRRPWRVVLDTGLRTPPHAHLLTREGAVLVFAREADGQRVPALREAGAEVVVLPGEGRGVDLGAALAELGRRECNEVLVEAGPTLSGALLGAGLVDRLVLYLAPRVMGDAARGMFHLPGLSRLADAPRWRMTGVDRVGDDLRVTLEPAAGAD
jgi:diaminohydroxyphosphoribosylaminopyrimidine deaminase/5-amino-6-(5-phosphoribosylamino)uracil reductase